jgi:hypothetical protein
MDPKKNIFASTEKYSRSLHTRPNIFPQLSGRGGWMFESEGRGIQISMMENSTGVKGRL